MAYASTSSSDYISQINSLSKPTYTSKYGSIIEDLLNQIYTKEDFSYDFNADPLYQNYKDQYTKLGKEAAINAAAAVSTQTGGFGNSYAATAATQANQQYLTQLNEVIPDLYNAAMSKYEMETENLYNKFNAFETEENRQYNMYRDNVSDYYSDWSNLQSGYSTALNQEDWQAEFDYQKERDAVSDAQWQAEFDASNSQWQQEFDYNKLWNQTELDNENYWNGVSYALKNKSSSSGSNSGVSSNNSYYQKALAYANSSNGTIDNVDKYLTQMVKAGNISQTESQKIYNQILDETNYAQKVAHLYD